MAKLVSKIIEEAALMEGDPLYQSTTLDQWLTLYNMATRWVCQKYDVLKRTWIANLELTHVYTYPEDMKTLTSLRASLTPDDIASFQDIVEYENEDQFRWSTNNAWPDADIPAHYYADPEVIFLVGKPTTQIVRGMELRGYATQPSDVVTLGGAVHELPLITVDLVRDVMLVFSKRARKQYAEAAEEQAAIEQVAARYEQQIEDRSEDRPASLRPRSAANPYGDMA